MLGRHPDAGKENADKDGPKFCAALYSIVKGGVKCLDFGPRMGQTMKEALIKLLRLVETRIGEMMIDDKEDARERGRSGGGN